MLFSSLVKVMVIIRLSVWLISGYADLFILLSVVIINLPCWDAVIVQDDREFFFWIRTPRPLFSAIECLQSVGLLKQGELQRLRDAGKSRRWALGATAASAAYDVLYLAAAVCASRPAANCTSTAKYASSLFMRTHGISRMNSQMKTTGTIVTNDNANIRYTSLLNSVECWMSVQHVKLPSSVLLHHVST